jgi:hypothetical protein
MTVNTSSRLQSKADSELTKYEMLVKKYGGSINAWKAAGAASLISAEALDGISAHQKLGLQSSILGGVQDEIASRASESILNIGEQERQVVGMQKAHFAKSGVKLEGSAIDVIQETINKATESMLVKQREADFKSTQLDVQKKLSQFQQSTIATNSLLSIANIGAKAYTGV